MIQCTHIVTFVNIRSNKYRKTIASSIYGSEKCNFDQLTHEKVGQSDLDFVVGQCLLLLTFHIHGLQEQKTKEAQAFYILQRK